MAALLLLAAASCSMEGTGPTGPAVSDRLVVDEAPPPVTDLAKGVDPDIRPISNQVSWWVDASEGATIRFGALTLSIPPDALVQDQAVTVRLLQAGRQLEYDLLPHGVYFLEPATLSIDASKARAGTSRATALFALDESRGVWVDLGAGMVSKSTILSAPLDRLTRVRAGIAIAPAR